jgi:acetyl-CoA decarbonylase/synthase complex subunit gamma
MALSGLDIFKLLPKTNCGDCGIPTCLAFAMKLAQKKAELSECPHASEEAKEVLGAASEPPMRLLKIGIGADAFEIGGETEMFRHEKTFYHQTAIAIRIEDSDNDEAIAAKVSAADSYVIERVGESLHIDAFCLSNVSQDREKYLASLEVLSAHSSKGVIIDCADRETIKAALQMLNSKKPVIFPRDADASQYVDLAQDAGVGLIVTSGSANDLAALTEKITQNGFKDLLLNLKSSTLGDRLQNNTMLRRAALRKGFKPFGFPQVWFMESGAEHELLADAIVGTCKYSGIIILPDVSKEMMLTLFTLRQNIYTDPQKPIQVDPKLYAIGEPKPDSPVFVTTNFSLTYFIVSGEIENAGISAWLIIPDCEGMSVLTAWAAGKFSGEKIGKFVRDIGLEQQVTTREIVIPGYVASISGDLEEVLPNWLVVVGPQEASDLGPFIKNYSLSKSK